MRDQNAFFSYSINRSRYQLIARLIQCHLASFWIYSGLPSTTIELISHVCFPLAHNQLFSCRPPVFDLTASSSAGVFRPSSSSASSQTSMLGFCHPHAPVLALSVSHFLSHSHPRCRSRVDLSLFTLPNFLCLDLSSARHLTPVLASSSLIVRGFLAVSECS